MNKLRAHTQYKLSDGSRVPSVTTVIGILAKNALIEWAYQCGLQSIDYKAVRDNAGDVGSLAHYLIMCHLKGETPDTSEYSEQDISRAETCLIKYWDWEKQHSSMEPVLVETPLVSEIYRFGGTVDCLAKLNGDMMLIDYKTGKAIYDEHIMQVSAYAHLLQENGYTVNTVKILRIGKEEKESFEERTISDLETGWQIFLRCLDIYNLQKNLK